MFIVKSSQPIGEYPAGGMYFFDYDLEPSSNQLVIAVPDKDSNPEIMVYFQARGKKFLKSLVEDLPLELRNYRNYWRYGNTSNILEHLLSYKSLQIK